MRPIERGAWPIDPKLPTAKLAFKDYQYARRYLIDNISDHCSYCEQMVTNPAVEHIEPKTLAPALKLEWTNFVLSCVNCNSTKGKKPVRLNDYFWPDKHNTFMALEYNSKGIVRPAKRLSAISKQRVKNTIALVGLNNKMPKAGTLKYQEASDRRMEKRLENWREAMESLKSYEAAPLGSRPALALLIQKIVRFSGFWSIWMTVFKNHKEVRLLLIQGIAGKGTPKAAPNCFDADSKAIKRNGRSI